MLSIENKKSLTDGSITSMKMRPNVSIDTISIDRLIHLRLCPAMLATLWLTVITSGLPLRWYLLIDCTLGAHRWRKKDFRSEKQYLKTMFMFKIDPPWPQIISLCWAKVGRYKDVYAFRRVLDLYGPAWTCSQRIFNTVWSLPRGSPRIIGFLVRNAFVPVCITLYHLRLFLIVYMRAISYAAGVGNFKTIWHVTRNTAVTIYIWTIKCDLNHLTCYPTKPLSAK